MRKKWADFYVMVALMEAVFKTGHWRNDGLDHEPFHHNGLFLCSVLWLVYLAEVHIAAFSTDPYFGRPPLHCLVAQVVWEGVRRHQWSWEGQEKGKRQSSDRHCVSTWGAGQWPGDIMKRILWCKKILHGIYFFSLSLFGCTLQRNRW